MCVQSLPKRVAGFGTRQKGSLRIRDHMCVKMGKLCWHYPPGYMASCTIIILYTFLCSAKGVTLSSCESDNTVVLLETRGDNTITCSGIPADYTVNWKVTQPSGPGTYTVGTCNPGGTTCTNFSALGYQAQRPVANTSVITIDPRVSVDDVKNGTLECQATKSGQVDQTKDCRMDIVYPASNVTCDVQLNITSLSVVGRCNVTMVYSYNGRYSCQWYSQEGSDAEKKINVTVAMQTTPTAKVSITGENIINVVFTANLPMLLGSTQYKVVIFPEGDSYDAGYIKGPQETEDCCLLYLLLLLLLLLFLPIPVPLPWPGYPLYVLICWFISNCFFKSGKGARSPPPGWHSLYMCCKKIDYVHFSSCCVTNDGRAVLIWSNSPVSGQFVWYDTLKTPGTNSSGAGDEMDAPPSHRSGAGDEMGAPPSHRNNVSPESGVVKNGNKHTSQKEKNKHTGTDGSPRKSRQPEAPVELSTVRTSSPPQAATVHGDNQASGTPHGDHQASGTPRLRPLPEPSRMTSVERNSTAETSNMLGRDKHLKLPPIGKPDNHP